MKRAALAVLISAFGGLCLGSVSTNVPLYHWSYAAIDKLIGEGLIDSAMVGTRPFSRLEMARLISEADAAVERQGEKNQVILAVLDRLEKEFRLELSQVNSVRTGASEDYVKPLEDPYVRFVHGDDHFDLENQSGDRFDKGSNARLGFDSRMSAFDAVAFYVHPEYGSPSLDSQWEAVEAYGKTSLGKLEIEVGKDSMWWGPGYHGSILMSNNASPFTMLKVSNPEPIQLPWILERLGPFKAVYFLTELEENRDHPHTRLTGLRLSIKPHPSVELGGSRTIMFGGGGLPDIGAKDYLHVFWPTHEQSENNQLAGVDASVLVRCPEWLPLRTVQVFADAAGEDEAGYLPSKWGGLYGILLSDLLKTGRTDLRVEYANNHVQGSPNVFYTHSLYTSGYTYRGRVIGHFMGTDAEDLLVRATHYLSPDLVLGADFERLQGNLSGTPRPVTSRYGADVSWFAPHNWQFRAAYRYEQTTLDPESSANHILDLSLVYDF
jgi:hypothetical protein